MAPGKTDFLDAARKKNRQKKQAERTIFLPVFLCGLSKTAVRRQAISLQLCKIAGIVPLPDTPESGEQYVFSDGPGGKQRLSVRFAYMIMKQFTFSNVRIWSLFRPFLPVSAADLATFILVEWRAFC